jgi:MFS family permease
VVAFLAFLALLACIALYLTAGRVSFSITVLLAALWGGGALSFYSISASHATDRTDAGQIAQVMSGMLFIWAGGSVLGPILTGAVADTQAGQPGVFPAVALGYFGLMAANLGRLFLRDRPTGSQRSPFQPLQATSLVQGKVVEEAECAAQAGDASPSAPPPKPAPKPKPKPKPV